MVRRFKSILVPVDFSGNTDIAISKALSLCSAGCTLHLLHVQQTGHGSPFQYLKSLFRSNSRRLPGAGNSQPEGRLMDLKRTIEKGKNNIKVYASVCYGESVQHTIAKKATDFAVDLVVLGKHSSHSTFPKLNTVTPGSITLSSGIPVLTAKPGSLNHAVKKVVIPVGMEFPANKLAIMEALQQQSGLEIILVVFPYDTSVHSFSKQTLLTTFRILKSQSANPVRYEVLQGRNKALALMNYCMRTNTDILVVYPGIETRVGSWVNSHISDLLPANSRTQVLAIKPANHFLIYYKR
jgi:nucleotide-binding universal stress UspA family protein